MSTESTSTLTESTSMVSVEAVGGGLVFACISIAFIAWDLFRMHTRVNSLENSMHQYVRNVMQEMDAMRATVAGFERV